MTIWTMRAFLVVLAVGASVLEFGVAQGSPPLLPAYSHNDYLNDRPLFDALDLGYRGVEVDYFVVEGKLMVAHDRDQIQPGRTLEALYLEPLKQRIQELGSVLPDGSVFTINIESKESGNETYGELHRVLAAYEEILTSVVDGQVRPGPVQVILVGWSPPLHELAGEPVRYVGVHRHYSDLPDSHARYPSHLLKLVSVNYRQTFRWHGMGPPSTRISDHLTAIVQARDAADGRLVRVYNVPRNASVYSTLLDSGVDLIGTKTLGTSRSLLLRLMR